MYIKELGHVVLYVTSLKKSVHFYKEILGFGLIAEQPGMAAFSSGRTHHEMLLIEIGGKKKQKKLEPGLYHIGFKIGESGQELKKAYDELKRKEVKITGSADHTVSHSLYIEDPDGNEIELYVDITEKWKKDKKLIMAPIKP